MNATQLTALRNIAAEMNAKPALSPEEQFRLNALNFAREQNGKPGAVAVVVGGFDCSALSPEAQSELRKSGLQTVSPIDLEPALVIDLMTRPFESLSEDEREERAEIYEAACADAIAERHGWDR